MLVAVEWPFSDGLACAELHLHKKIQDWGLGEQIVCKELYWLKDFSHVLCMKLCTVTWQSEILLFFSHYTQTVEI